MSTGPSKRTTARIYDRAALEAARRVAKARTARAGDVLTDLAPVVEAVIEAATHPDPKTRYVVGKGMAEMLAPVVRELDKLQEFDLQRAGFR